MSGRLHGDEREDETEDEGEESGADVHVEELGEDSAASDGAEEQASDPPGVGNTVLNGSLVLIVLADATLEPLARVEVFLFEGDTAERGDQGDDDVREGVHQHDEDTGPEQPVTSGGAGDVSLEVIEDHADVAGELGEVLGVVVVDSDASLDHGGSNDGPSKEGTTHCDEENGQGLR